MSGSVGRCRENDLKAACKCLQAAFSCVNHLYQPLHQIDTVLKPLLHPHDYLKTAYRPLMNMAAS